MPHSNNSREIYDYNSFMDKVSALKKRVGDEIIFHQYSNDSDKVNDFSTLEKDLDELERAAISREDDKLELAASREVDKLESAAKSLREEETNTLFTIRKDINSLRQRVGLLKKSQQVKSEQSDDMALINDLKQQARQLQKTVQQFSSRQSDVSGDGTIVAIKKADQQFTEARNLFYKLQWQGHGWFKEFGSRAVFNFAKDVDRIVSSLLSVWYRDKVKSSFAQDWVLSWTIFAEIKSKHQQMIQFQKELTSAAALISAYKKKAANRVSDISTGEEKRKKSGITSSLMRCFRVAVWVLSIYLMTQMPAWFVSALMLITFFEIVMSIGRFILEPRLDISSIFFVVMISISEKFGKLAAGEYLDILYDIRVDLIIWGLLMRMAVSSVSMTKYIVDLPQKLLSGVMFIEERLVLKVNKIKEALSPTALDWSKLFRNIISCLVFMTLVSVPEMLLLGAPVVNWTSWAIIACHQVVYLLVQTLTEEIMFRRGLVEQENTTIDKLVILVICSVSFALAHLANPEFKIIGSNPYAVFAMLGGYLASGLVYGSVCIMSGGIELAWALHFANNFFIATIMGYTPSPSIDYPLYLTVRDESHGPTNYLLGLSSYAQALSYWGEVFYGELLMLVPVFACESFARPRYDVESVCGYVSYGDMVNEEKSQKEAKRKSETAEKVTNKPGMFESMWRRGMSSIIAF